MNYWINTEREAIGLKQAQWQITKAMLALDLEFDMPEVKRLLKFIHDEIEKEKK